MSCETTSTFSITTETPKQDWVETRPSITEFSNDSVTFIVNFRKERCLKHNYNVNQVLYCIPVNKKTNLKIVCDVNAPRPQD